MTEEWRTIPEYEGYYEVSNLGNVRGLERTFLRLNSHGSYSFFTRKPRPLRPIVSPSGHHSVVLCKDGKQKSFGIHRLVCIAFLDNPENKPYVNHIDGRPSNNSLSNLEWCTPKENVAHAIRIGLVNNKGENNPAAVHPTYKVAFVKAITALGLFSDRAIGNFIGTSREFVKDIRSGRNWQSVPPSKLNIVSITKGN